MNITNSLQEIACSDYACDRAFLTDLRGKQSVKWIQAGITMPWIGLLDTISQAAKGILELMLWPVVGIGLVGYTLLFLPIKLYQGQLEIKKSLMIGLSILFYAPLSAMNRVRLIAVSVFGSIGAMSPKGAALERQGAFASPLFLDRSLLTWLKNTLWKGPVERSSSPAGINQATYSEMLLDADAITLILLRVEEYCRIATQQINDHLFDEASQTLVKAYCTIEDKWQVECLCKIAKVRLHYTLNLETEVEGAKLTQSLESESLSTPISRLKVPLEINEALDVLKEMNEMKAALNERVRSLCAFADFYYEAWKKDQKTETFQEAIHYIEQAQEYVTADLYHLRSHFEGSASATSPAIERTKKNQYNNMRSLSIDVTQLRRNQIPQSTPVAGSKSSMARTPNMEVIESLLIIAKTQKKMAYDSKDIVNTIELALPLLAGLEGLLQMNIILNIARFLITVNSKRAKQVISIAQQKGILFEKKEWMPQIKIRIENILMKWEAANK